MPYQDELIYSTIARYGIHLGLTSPKQLLDEVYCDRKVIATTDLPNQLSLISKHYADCHQYDTEYLIYNHTLFPLYAPFVPEERRLKCLGLMAGTSQGAIHLALGVAASRVKQKLSLRYCPQCMQLQKQEYGEYFWQRLWQVSGADTCILHGELKEALVERHSHHRHQFFAASPENCPDVYQQESRPESLIVTEQVKKLLNRPQSKSATLAQWSVYYKYLADINGYRKGQFIRYEEIKERVLRYWPTKWLMRHALDINNAQSCWLRTIFRKHRKSFSYLEHIVIHQSFLSKDWDINTVLNEVSHLSPFSKSHIVPSSINDISTEGKLQNRQSWEALVKQCGVKSARQTKQGGAIYAWLYRHDKVWLLELNSQYRIYPTSINNRVDWNKKDKRTVCELIQIRNCNDELLEQPKMSRNWYLSQIQSPASIEKNIYKMPLCQQFFSRNCESTTEYQIRRITRVIAQLNVPLSELRRWKVLRMAGLSEERLRRGSNDFLTEIVGM